MGKLERKLDEDLIDRIAAGWTPTARTKASKKVSDPRESTSYRAARRNEARGTVWKAIDPSQLKRQIHPAMRLNRSKKWDGVALTKPYR